MTFRVYASTVTPGGSPWVLGPAAPGPGPNTAVLYGGFNAASPLLGDFGPDDVILGVSQLCTATAYAIGEGCANLSPGAVRTLWLRLDMPTESDAATEQHIQVTVEAGPP